MYQKSILFILLSITPVLLQAQVPDAFMWKKYEIAFTSSVSYENPVQDLKSMEVIFTSPSGKIHTINSFWDGENLWKVRFMPDETGKWLFGTKCSDQNNPGLNNQKGTFLCKNNNDTKIFINLDR